MPSLDHYMLLFLLHPGSNIFYADSREKELTAEI